jgi:OFA family oxalate/formate antiporter-like MFS transporter
LAFAAETGGKGLLDVSLLGRLLGEGRGRILIMVIFYGWWMVFLCFAIAFYVGGALFYGFTAFFEPIVKEFGWSYTQVSVAFSLRGLEMGILAPITGVLVDRFGSKRLIFAGASIVGLALILLSFTRSLVMFYTAFVLMAIGTSGCATTVLMTAVAQWFRKNAGKAMGIVTCGFGAGGLLVPLIVWLIDKCGWRTSLIVLGLSMWALGIPLSFFIRHKPEQYGYLPDGGKMPQQDTDPGSDEMDEGLHFKEAVRGRNFWIIGIAETIRLMINMAIIAHVMPYLSSLGMSRSGAAIVATSIPLLSVTGRFGFGWVADIFDKRLVLIVTYCLLGLGILTFSYVHVRWLLIPFLLLFAPALGGGISLRSVILRDYFGRNSFGTLLGMIVGMATVGSVIGPTAAGWTFDTWGTYRPIWLCFAGASLIALLLILYLHPPTKGIDSSTSDLLR